jgi:hypothetical protein
MSLKDYTRRIAEEMAKTLNRKTKGRKDRRVKN